MTTKAVVRIVPTKLPFTCVGAGAYSTTGCVRALPGKRSAEVAIGEPNATFVRAYGYGGCLYHKGSRICAACATKAGLPVLAPEAKVSSAGFEVSVVWATSPGEFKPYGTYGGREAAIEIASGLYAVPGVEHVRVTETINVYKPGVK